METQKIRVGGWGFDEPKWNCGEVVQFVGEKVGELKDGIAHYVLYECPEGYRVLVGLNLESVIGRDEGYQEMAPNGNSHLFSEEEARVKFPELFEAIGLPKITDLDAERAESQEHVVRFVRNLRLLQKTRHLG